VRASFLVSATVRCSRIRRYLSFAKQTVAKCKGTEITGLWSCFNSLDGNFYGVITLLLRPNDVSRSDFIFYLWTFIFLPLTVIAARRHSGAPSKVYQWLDPRCRHKMTQKHFANRSPNFHRGSKTAKFGLDSRHQSPWKRSSFEMEQHIGNLKHAAKA